MNATDYSGASMSAGSETPQDDTLGNSQTLTSKLLHLKTIAEINAGRHAIKVYVLRIPIRTSSTVLKILKEGVIDRTGLDLQHLRRIVKAEHVPQHVRDLFPPSGDDKELGYMFVCPHDQLWQAELEATLVGHLDSPFRVDAEPPSISVTTVPLYAPTTASQAAQWSQEYWPISYKNTNPYGPHPSLVGRAEAELTGKNGNGVKQKMRLALQVAQESTEMRMGPRVGCVILARGQEWYADEEIVAVGADSRWYHVERGNSSGLQAETGNVMAHSVMRAIGMVAQKRLRIASTLDSPVGPDTSPVWHDAHHDDAFLDTPLTPLEAEYYARDNLTPYGYLCCDLEIYITHEPCVMCSMAILHSRFARCIFGKRMPLSGGMTADGDGLHHGLFWRPSELNWKLLCWEWQQDDTESKQHVDEKLNV